MTTLMAVYDSDSCVGRCDAECYDATEPGCGCICGGLNHGAGEQQAISNTLKSAYEWLDQAIVANPSILAANIMPDARALALTERNGGRVTEPDPIAALAAQLEELRGQLARYTGETGHLRAKLAEDSGQVVMLRLEIKQLAEKITAAIARRNADEPPAPFWLGLSREEHARPVGRAPRVGRSRRHGPVPRVLCQASALLGESCRARARGQQRDDGVDPGVRRSG